MNKLEKLKNRRNVLDLFETNSISGKMGFVKIWGGSKGHCNDSHELVKFLVCKKLKFVYGFEFWTEVIFKNKCRADILCIDSNGEGTIVEVLDTESEEKFSVKLEKYPLPIHKVYVKDFDIDKWDF